MTDIITHINGRMEAFYKKEGKWPNFVVVNHYTRMKLLNYFYANYHTYKGEATREEKLNGAEILLRPSDYNEELYIKLL